MNAGCAAVGYTPDYFKKKKQNKSTDTIAA